MSPYASMNMTLGKCFKADEGSVHMDKRGGGALDSVKCSINKEQLKSAQKRWGKTGRRVWLQ